MDVGPEAGGAIARLTQELGKLPGIGPKTAERLTHFLLAASSDQVLGLSDALRAIKEQIRRCRQCVEIRRRHPRPKPGRLGAGVGPGRVAGKPDALTLRLWLRRR